MNLPASAEIWTYVLEVAPAIGWQLAGRLAVGIEI
jgi:hypothetical protein